MNVMTAPDVWSDQDRALTVEDMENMPGDPVGAGAGRPLTGPFGHALVTVSGLLAEEVVKSALPW
jgi:hypothetical protein